MYDIKTVVNLENGTIVKDDKGCYWVVVNTGKYRYLRRMLNSGRFKSELNSDNRIFCVVTNIDIE